MLSVRILLTTSLLSLTALAGCTPREMPRVPSSTGQGSTDSADSIEYGSLRSIAGPASNGNITTATNTTVPGYRSNTTVPGRFSNTTAPRPRVVVRQKPRAVVQPGQTTDLTFDDLKFDIEPDANFDRSMLPTGIEDYGNQSIRIRGYMLPSFQQRDIKQFVLVRDNLECCFGPGAALYDCILVEMEGKGIDFTVRPITVEGTFSIREYKSPEGQHLAIYHLVGEDAG